MRKDGAVSPTPAGPRKVLRWLRKRILPPPTPVRSPEMMARDAILAGDQARDRHDWTAAAEAYRQALTHRPGDAGIGIQHGHMLKEAGRLEEAEAAYRAAGEAAPFDADPWLQRAHVLKALGRGEEAIAAFVEALRRDPKALGARDELISLGMRHRIPRSAYGSTSAVRDVATIGRSLESGLSTLKDWVQVSTYPLDAWDAFRRAYPVAPPPAALIPDEAVAVVVDARGASAAALVRTLDSLLDQSRATWTAQVISDAALSAHPVAGLEALDARITFAAPTVASVGDARLLVVPAGVVLDRHAIAWLSAALTRTRAAAVHADHDRHEDHWRLGPLFQSPALQSAPDADDLATNPMPPVVVMLAPGQAGRLIEALATGIEPAALGRALILAARNDGPAAHLPRLLSSVWIGSVADAAPAPLPRPAPEVGADRILVIIPTRDQAGLLKTCIQSLRAHAEQADAIDILVVDNRSTEPETAALFAELRAEGVEILTADEPFNWSRLNTEAAKGRSQPLIAFANNDIEALSRGWDSVVRRELARPGIGVVGARLLYGDRTLQHAGILLDAVEGRPMHEGVSADPLEDGPVGRYRRTRPVAAVTGAFMAVRRETFEQLGGFDPRLAVGYNDIDLCLKARAAGLKVLYAADLVLIHHESKTRGLNDSADKIAWDDTELKRLHDRWGQALFRDPGVNPHWSAGPGRPMDGYRDPSLMQILDWLDRSASIGPWTLALQDNGKA